LDRKVECTPERICGEEKNVLFLPEIEAKIFGTPTRTPFCGIVNNVLCADGGCKERKLKEGGKNTRRMRIMKEKME
jgi:hypothetical protein